MTSKRLFCFVAGLLIGGSLLICATQNLFASSLTGEPPVSLKKALALAEQYVAKEKIDVSAHFMESVRLVHITDNPKGKRLWIVTWTLKKPSDGGQVFINVEMDKTVSMIGGM